MADIETEAQIAYDQGFEMYEVREDYVIRDDRLWPQGKIKYEYAPMIHTELPTEIAKLTRGDNNAVLRFARRYGLLGYCYVLEVKDITRRVGWNQEEVGEPLNWIWGHASTINACLTLTSLLQAGDETALQSYFYTFRGPVASGLNGIVPDGFGTLLGERGFSSFPGLGITENVKWFRRQTVNDNIGPVTRTLCERDEKGEKSYYNVKGTVRAAYWHLATLIEAGKYRLVRCKDPECQAWFAQRDPRQRFCPAQVGMKESRCSARYRMRARRADQREQREA